MNQNEKHQNYKEPEIAIGKYGRMHETYLKQHSSQTYKELKIRGRLQSYLREIDKSANCRIENFIREQAIENCIDEEMKAKNQLEWVAKMNALRQQAEEIVLDELVYC